MPLFLQPLCSKLGRERSAAVRCAQDGGQRICFLPSLPPMSPMQNLLRAGSSVLAPENREHWAMLPHSEHGSASLLEQLRDYSGTLASNMKLTYLNPVGVVTPNISE